MSDERDVRRPRLVVPRALALNVLGVVLAACAPAAPHADASPGSDAVVAMDVAPNGDGAPCSAVMPGRTCTTDCVTLGSAPDGFAGLIPQPCEVYCDLDGGECYGADGRLSACERSGDGDGGTKTFC